MRDANAIETAADAGNPVTGRKTTPRAASRELTEGTRATPIPLCTRQSRRPGYPVDLVAGHVPASISSVSDLIEMHRAHKLRIISVSGTQRLAQLPDVPTFIEQGYPSIQAAGWVGVFAPRGTPKEVVDRWSTVFATIVRSPQTAAKLAELGFEPTGTTSVELSATLAADIARWAPIVKASGFQAD